MCIYIKIYKVELLLSMNITCNVEEHPIYFLFVFPRCSSTRWSQTQSLFSLLLQGIPWVPCFVLYESLTENCSTCANQSKSHLLLPAPTSDHVTCVRDDNLAACCLPHSHTTKDGHMQQ